MRRARFALALVFNGCAGPVAVATPDPAASSTTAPRLATERPLDVKRTVESHGRFGVSFALPAGATIKMHFVSSAALSVKVLRHPDGDVVERGESLDVVCPGHSVAGCRVIHSDGGREGEMAYQARQTPDYTSFVWENPGEDPVAVEVHFDMPRGARLFSDIPRDE